MTTHIAPHAPVEDWQKMRDEWIAEINRMAGDVERWSAENDWDTRRDTKDVIEDEIGEYKLPVVRVQTMHGRILFDPIARFLIGATGRIEIIGMPSFSQVVVVKVDGQWQFYDENLEDLRRSWSREAFIEIVGELLKAP